MGRIVAVRVWFFLEGFLGRRLGFGVWLRAGNVSSEV